jgi:NitT/TauT family transport system ATP-binding protein
MAAGEQRPVSKPLIQVQGVSKSFAAPAGQVIALDDVSLTVERGEVLTILGPSGCGKSTLLNMVAGFVRPSSGRVFLDGVEISGVEPRCGMVFQSYALFPWMTVLENVAFGPRLKGRNATKCRKLARHWLAKVGLEGFEDAYPGELSGGMQQRVALCRPLANGSEVLLCDEPFAALDAMTRQLMQEELLRLVGKSGQTVLFITHSIDEALVLSDRLIVMSARPGRVRSAYRNELPRPRHVDTQLSPEFLALKREIWAQVEEEVARAAGFGT